MLSLMSSISGGGAPRDERFVPHPSRPAHSPDAALVILSVMSTETMAAFRLAMSGGGGGGMSRGSMASPSALAALRPWRS